MTIAATSGSPGMHARLGFAGVGWIGLDRMRAMLDTGVVEAAAIADVNPQCIEQAAGIVPRAAKLSSFPQLLELGLDGIVIATPSALHAGQAVAALETGHDVFCQKPLGRNAIEAAEIIATARRADRLLGVDMSYRFAAACRAVRDVIVTGGIGDVHAGELTFHNAYGPDKSWFYDRELSGGGCVLDLGIHLADMALWTLGFPKIASVTPRLFENGRRMRPGERAVETFASVSLETENGAVLQLLCSWGLHAGRDAIISADFHGRHGGASFRNVGGSFYDFVADRFEGTASQRLVEPPDPWGARAAADWARRMADGQGFDASIEEALNVARLVDRIYAGA